MAKAQNPEQHSAGQLLKQVRESKGIPLGTVHAATKIPLDALKAIEEGYTVRMLSPFYIKGFIKMYAQYLGVDVTQVREDYHAEKLPKALKPVDPAADIEKKVKQIFTRERQKIIVQLLAFAVVLFFVSKIAGCIKAYNRQPADQKIKNTQSSSKKTISVATLEPRTIKKEAEKGKKQDTKKETKKVAAQPVTKKVDPAPMAAVQEKPSSVEKETVVPASAPEHESNNVRLTIRTRKSGWLQVKVDGNVVFQSTIKEGAVETWEASKNIEISGKDIHNLEFEVNGKMVGTLGRADRNARRVIITKEGLTVKE